MRIAAGEQRDIISQRYQFLGQPVYHSLGSAIKFGGNSLRQRSNLRDAHLFFSCLWSWITKAPSPSWHRHAELGTFSHLRSSLEQRTSSAAAYFLHSRVLLMPLRPIRLLPLPMLQDCCAEMAASREPERRVRRSLACDVSR